MTKGIEAAEDSLSGAYVLNSLSEEERRAFERRMADSDDLRNEVTELADTAVLLGMATTPVEPSPALRASVLAAVAQLPQLPREPVSPSPTPQRSQRTAETTQPGGTVITPSATGGGAEARAATRWLRRPLGVVTVAAAALALLFGGVLLGTAITGPTPEQQHTAAFAELNAAPDVERMAAQVDGGGSATLIVSQALGRSAFVWYELPHISEDRVFELWYITDAPKPAGTFEPDAPANFRVLDGELPDGAVVGVTVEPEGGSEQPTTEPIVVMETTGA